MKVRLLAYFLYFGKKIGMYDHLAVCVSLGLGISGYAYYYNENLTLINFSAM
jgi:hypothetical protein